MYGGHPSRDHRCLASLLLVTALEISGLQIKVILMLALFPHWDIFLRCLGKDLGDTG